MALKERIGTILAELDIKQADFAKELGITASYVNMLLNGKRDNISASLSNLIQERYGYSFEWIMYGTGDKNIHLDFSATKQEVIDKIKKMNANEVRAVLAYVKALETIPPANEPEPAGEKEARPIHDRKRA